MLHVRRHNGIFTWALGSAVDTPASAGKTYDMFRMSESVLFAGSTLENAVRAFMNNLRFYKQLYT